METRRKLAKNFKFQIFRHLALLYFKTIYIKIKIHKNKSYFIIYLLCIIITIKMICK